MHMYWSSSPSWCSTFDVLTLFKPIGYLLAWDMSWSEHFQYGKASVNYSNWKLIESLLKQYLKRFYAFYTNVTVADYENTTIWQIPRWNNITIFMKIHLYDQLQDETYSRLNNDSESGFIGQVSLHKQGICLGTVALSVLTHITQNIHYG